MMFKRWRWSVTRQSLSPNACIFFGLKAPVNKNGFLHKTHLFTNAATNQTRRGATPAVKFVLDGSEIVGSLRSSLEWAMDQAIGRKRKLVVHSDDDRKVFNVAVTSAAQMHFQGSAILYPKPGVSLLMDEQKVYYNVRLQPENTDELAGYDFITARYRAARALAVEVPGLSRAMQLGSVLEDVLNSPFMEVKQKWVEAGSRSKLLCGTLLRSADSLRVIRKALLDGHACILREVPLIGIVPAGKGLEQLAFLNGRADQVRVTDDGSIEITEFKVTGFERLDKMERRTQNRKQLELYGGLCDGLLNPEIDMMSRMLDQFDMTPGQEFSEPEWTDFRLLSPTLPQNTAHSVQAVIDFCQESCVVPSYGQKPTIKLLVKYLYDDDKKVQYFRHEEYVEFKPLCDFVSMLAQPALLRGDIA